MGRFYHFAVAKSLPIAGNYSAKPTYDKDCLSVAPCGAGAGGWNTLVKQNAKAGSKKSVSIVARVLCMRRPSANTLANLLALSITPVSGVTP
jgi:hypothetical protein